MNNDSGAFGADGQTQESMGGRTLQSEYLDESERGGGFGNIKYDPAQKYHQNLSVLKPSNNFIPKKKKRVISTDYTYTSSQLAWDKSTAPVGVNNASATQKNSPDASRFLSVEQPSAEKGVKTKFKFGRSGTK